jgi:glycine dehydrogenase subunit 1
MRYLPLSEPEREDMLKRMGLAEINQLFADAPAGTLLDRPLDLPRRKSEMEVERLLGALAAKNLTAGAAPFFLGAGAAKHHVPASVDHLIQRSEFLTSYTPYQPEISQGTLQVLFEFQTQVARLTGMEVANASMYDGSTATAEAVLMAHRVARRRKALLSGGLHPHYAATAKTLSDMAEDEIVLLPPDPLAQEDLIGQLDDSLSCLVVQSPDFFGNLRDLRPLAEACHAKGVLLIAVVTEIVALGAIEPPGAQGADIVVAEGQSIGNGLNFGGPYLGLFATREKYLRQMPGRLCGQTLDGEGRRGFVLTLSTREQHIRREKATSNICTNSGLCALAFSIHLSLLGAKGLNQLAQVNHGNAVALAEQIEAIPGIALLNQTFFNEFCLRLPGSAADFVERAAGRGLLAGAPVSRLWPGAGLDDLLLVASSETNTDDDRAALVAALKEVAGA